MKKGRQDNPGGPWQDLSFDSSAVQIQITRQP